MRVLYVGQLWLGGTCRERMRVQCEAGWTVFPFDTTPYLKSSGRVWAAIQHRLLLGPDVTRFNKTARRKIAEAGRARALAQYHWRHVLRPAMRRVEEIVRGG